MAIQKKSLHSTSKSANKAKASAGNPSQRKGPARGTKTVNLRKNALQLPAVQ